MTFKRTLATAATGLALVLAPVMPALAQESAPATPEAVDQVSDEQLTLFVTAAMNVLEVADQYRDQMDSETDETARQELAEEANLAMLDAVEETDGISVDEYLAISRAAQADPDLNERVMEKFEEMGGEQG